MYSRFFVLFAILFTGWALRKTNFIDDKMDHSINKLIIYFAYPCMIVHNIGSIEMSGQVIVNFVLTFFISLGSLYLYSAIAYGYSKMLHLPREISNVAEFAMVAPNNGFMGFPVTLLFFGEQGLLLMLAHNSAMNFYLFTYGLKLMKRNRSDRMKKTPKSVMKAAFRLITNPNIIALCVGFILSVFSIPIPEAVDDYLVYIGDISTPMAMIFIGSSLVKYKFTDIIRSAMVIECSVMKLIILPLITTGIMYFLPVSPLIKCIVILGACFPTAANVPMFAEQEGQDIGTGSRVLFLSTVASMITIPLSVTALNFLFM